jgi:hypothetical protein
MKRVPASRPGIPGKGVVIILLIVVLVVSAFAIVKIVQSTRGPETAEEPPAVVDTFELPGVVDDTTRLWEGFTDQELADLKAQGLEHPAEDIMADLERRTDLVPREGVVGGTMRFWPDQSRIVSPNKAYAYYEDGHIAVGLLLEFTVRDGKIEWKVLDTLDYMQD